MGCIGSIDFVFYLLGLLLIFVGVFGCFMLMLKLCDVYLYFDEEEMVDYFMNFELEMIEQVKLFDIRMQVECFFKVFFIVCLIKLKYFKD